MITTTDKSAIETHLSSLVPDEWFEGPLQITVDDDEILIVGSLKAGGPGDQDPAAFREATRATRMKIADTVQPATQRVVSWGVRAGDEIRVFTGLGVPVMSRLRIHERDTLDTLIAGGVAKSRSEALAWCVRFVGQREAAWLGDLRTSLESVSEVRAKGPTLAG